MNGLGIGLLAFAGAAHAQVAYEIIDLTEAAQGFADNAEARAVNNEGRIVGFTTVGDEEEVGLVWNADGSFLFELEVLPKDTGTQGVGVNAENVIAGVSEEVFLLDGSPYEDQKATIWENGFAINVEDLVQFDPVMDPRFARDINGAGQIIGYARTFAGPPHEQLGFLAQNGQLFDLGVLNRPERISGEGRIVGRSIGEGPDRAYTWFGGEPVSLHVGVEGEASRAWDVNNADVIVGEAQFEAGGAVAPAIWAGGEAAPVIDARTSGSARAVNDAGVIVGWIGEESTGDGFVRVGDRVRMLIDAIPGDDGWERLTAYDVNLDGLIVGSGVRNGEAGRAFLLVPICVADFNADGALSILDFVALQQAFVDGDVAADVNADGVLNVLDFVAFQVAFVTGCG